MPIAQVQKAFSKVLLAAKNRYLQTIMYATEFAALNELGYVGLKPDLLLGPVPIYGVQREGHASSDEILKYRAMGSVFLAHQEGGKKTFTFTLKAFGVSRLLVLTFLKALMISGSETSKSIADVLDKNPVDTITSSEALLDGTTHNLISQYIEGSEKWTKNQIAYYKTIPIITSSKIYMNMYLETLRYKEDILLGADCMEIQCAFREYIAPTRARLVNVTAKEKKKGNKDYFNVWLDDKSLKLAERYGRIGNLLWASRKVIIEFLFNKNLSQLQKNKYTMEGGIFAASLALTMAYSGVS